MRKGFTQHYFKTTNNLYNLKFTNLFRNKKNKKYKKGAGFTLIEVLIASALTLIIFLGVFLAYQLGIRTIAQGKNKVIASAIASGEIEKIKNLSYNNIGIIDGFPEGSLELFETKNINGVDYTIEKKVDYVIDEADGISAPTDICPNDYKKIEIKVFWSGLLSGEVKLFTDIMPNNLAEECAEGGGILSIQVFNDYGNAIESPLIEVRNPDTEEVVRTAIPSDGNYIFSIPAGVYKVVVSKPGYGISKTYGTDEIANPEKPHLTVLESELTESSFSINELSAMSIETVGSEALEYPVISNAVFNLQGSKIIGTDADEQKVYKYSENRTTNESGQIVISELEPDLYVFTPVINLTNIESPPGIIVEQPVSLEPNVTQSVRLILESEHSLLLTVNDQGTGNPISFAECSLLYSGDNDITQYTGEDGRTYFVPVDAKIYTLEISASGYETYSSNISVFGETIENISLTRIE